LLCGTWSVLHNFNVQEGGLLEVRGYMYNARNNRKRDLVVEAGATLRIEGTLVVYGDLILEENAKLEFLGDTNRAYIYGDVEQSGSAEVTGEFNDYFGRF